MELFGTAGIRGSSTDRVTPELALAVGRAAGVDAEEFVLGRDGRETGGALADAMAAGLRSAGADVRRVGVVPTPALAFASRGRRGVMLTASHNPPQDNGIKLFDDGTEYDAGQESTIEDRVAADDPPAVWDAWGDAENADVLDEYRTAVAAYAREFGASLDGLKVVVDCGNGMGSVATPHVLESLGAEVVALNANVDGHFPGRPSKPTPETLGDFTNFVANADCAFGVAHDGDADRIVIVDASSEVVHEDTVLAVLAERYTRASGALDPVVVTTPNASARIDERVRAAGGRVERVRLGALHEGIASAEAAGGDVVYAAEPWKHIHPGFGGWIDGVASAAVLSRLVAAEGLDALRAPVTERPYRKVSVDCPDERKAAVMDALETEIPAAFPDADIDTEYGVRAEFSDGSWTLVRPSGTEPYVRVYAEADDVDALVDDVAELVEGAVANT
ncbi:phosphopentomutase/phosphoglucosamine mutase [Salarchaeum japonicum]|uniref:phosphopentomutase/phosphoglucosamine mutase n=1 Tax=Salarchaeum japonicum TaxID=555573 RepID=UPI003C75AA4A